LTWRNGAKDSRPCRQRGQNFAVCFHGRAFHAIGRLLTEAKRVVNAFLEEVQRECQDSCREDHYRKCSHVKCAPFLQQSEREVRKAKETRAPLFNRHYPASVPIATLHLSQWERTVADTRNHGTTRQQVGKAFADVERPALRPLPPSLFSMFGEVPRTMHRAYYSVPPGMRAVGGPAAAGGAFASRALGGHPCILVPIGLHAGRYGFYPALRTWCIGACRRCKPWSRAKQTSRR
jgi:hypothetical protein